TAHFTEKETRGPKRAQVTPGPLWRKRWHLCADPGTRAKPRWLAPGCESLASNYSSQEASGAQSPR
ncbi:hypothetical protein MC885_006611, partial [Smutsia gigantea]